MTPLKATAIALVVATIVLLVAVLPAEYGIDPLGTGHALGLTALAGVNDAPASADASEAGSLDPATSPSQHAAFAQDTYTVELRPFEAVEYKYRLEQGRGLVYEWTATAPVEWDFHGEPDGASARYSDSYEKGNSRTSNGVFIAQKPGIHGWFWENQGAGRITITLKTSGFYSASTEYRDGERFKKTFSKQ